MVTCCRLCFIRFSFIVCVFNFLEVFFGCVYVYPMFVCERYDCFWLVYVYYFLIIGIGRCFVFGIIIIIIFIDFVFWCGSLCAFGFS